MQRVPIGEGRFTPVVTDLRRRTQPILRYRLDDALVPLEAPCACGSVLTGLARIEGRADDCFKVLVNGAHRTLFPDVVRHAIVAASGPLESFGVRQIAEEEVELHLSLPAGADHEAAWSAATRGLATAFERLGGRAPRFRRLKEWTPVGPRKRKRVECTLPR